MASINEKGQLTLDYPFELKTNSRVEVIILASDLQETSEPSKQEIIADFRQAWHEAMTGQTITVLAMWEQLESEKYSHTSQKISTHLK